MSELRDAERMLEAAEQAANAGDLASADDLLRSVARIQEAELGALHPNVANTLNNLAVVAEKAGRLDDAGTFYRKAVAIASASLPADDPMIAASRGNLEDFCRAHGLPINLPAFLAPLGREAAAGLEVFAQEPAPGSAQTRVEVASDARLAATPPPFIAPSAAPRQRTPRAADPLPPASRNLSPWLTWAATGVVAAVVALLIGLPRSSSDSSTPPPAAIATPSPEAAPPPTVADHAVPPREEPPPAPAPAPAPVERSRPPAAVPRNSDPEIGNEDPPISAATSEGVSMATAQLCRTLSTKGGAWRCDEPDEPVPAGPLVFYTRVRSPRDAVVVHRWYRQNRLRNSVKLSIRASATEGYRTFSRQTVDAGMEWRVEVSTVKGDVLYERRFVVR